MSFASVAASRILRHGNGTVGTLPRIYNNDNKTYAYGYVEINAQATSPVARIKVHKAWLDGEAQVANGHLIQDRADGKMYFIMSQKPELYGGAVAYYDVTLYYCNTTCSVQRFGVSGKTAFGKPQGGAPTTLYENVYIMTTSLSVDVKEQEDQVLAQEKIKVAIQSKYGVKINDRLTCSNGDVYKVMSIDRTQLEGLWMLFVDKDIR